MSRSTRLWLLVVPPALVVGTAATALIFTSDHLQVPDSRRWSRADGRFLHRSWAGRTNSATGQSHRPPADCSRVHLVHQHGADGLGRIDSLDDRSRAQRHPGRVPDSPPAGLPERPAARARARPRCDRVRPGLGGSSRDDPFDPDPLSCQDTGCPSNALLVSDNELWRNLGRLVRSARRRRLPRRRRCDPGGPVEALEPCCAAP